MAASKKPTMLVEVTTLENGLEKSPPAASKSFPVQGKVVTVTQALATLASMQLVLAAPGTTRATWSKAVAAAKAQRAAYRAYLTALKRSLIQVYGSDTEGLAACGIVVTAPQPRTSKTNTIAAARAAATRVVNGTGKKPAAAQAQVMVVEPNGQVLGDVPSSMPVAAPAAGANAAPAVSAPSASAEPAPAGGAAPAAGK